jgi:single-strand DNA-binding protein
MALGDVQVTFVGNLTGDPELRFTPNGAAVANFTVACTPRSLDRTTNEWKDGETTFLRCQVWKQYAENVAESLTRGARVIVTGRLKIRNYETKEGEKRTSVEVDVDDIGPVLRNAKAKVERNSGGGAALGGGAASAPADDPWSSGAPAANTGGAWGGASATDEPPF